MFTLCDKAPGTISTGGMELDEFQILKGKSGTKDHGIPISRASVGAHAAEARSPVTTRRQDGLVRAEAIECAVFHVQSNDTHALAVLHDQVEGKVLGVQRLAVERVQGGHVW